VAGDLDNLRTRVPELTETTPTPDQDYPFRATVRAVDLAIGLGEAIQDIDYDNFKMQVLKRQGAGRAGMYSQVWAGLRNLPPVARDDAGPSGPTQPKVKQATLRLRSGQADGQ
jgi:hypothetical protein